MSAYIRFFLFLAFSSSFFLQADFTQKKVDLFDSLLRDLKTYYVRSNHTKEEIEQNQKLNPLAESLFLLHPTLRKDLPTQKFLDFLHIVTAQAHFYLTTSEITLAYRNIQSLKKLCDKQAKIKGTENKQELLRKLTLVSKKLPAYYALILQENGRLYFYERNLDRNNKLVSLEEAKTSILKSINLAEQIKENKLESTGHKKLSETPELFIYKRRLGYILFDEGKLEESKRLYESLLEETKDPYSKLLLWSHLMKINQRKAEFSKENKEKTLLYRRSHDLADLSLEILASYSWPSASRFYAKIAKFYLGEHSYRDLIKALSLLEKGKLLNEKYKMKDISIELDHLFSLTYKLLAQDSEKRVKDLQKNWLLKEDHLLLKKMAHSQINSDKELKRKSFLNLADIFSYKGFYDKSAIFEINSLALKKNSKKKSNQLQRLQDKILSFYGVSCVNPLPNSSDLEKHKASLISFRNKHKKAILESKTSVESLYKSFETDLKRFYQAILKDMISSLGKPPAKFSFLSMGSLGNGCATPFSDLEYLILIEQKNSRELDYFKALNELFKLELIYLNETSLHYTDFDNLFRWTKENYSPLQAGITPDSGGLSFVSSWDGFFGEFLTQQPLFKKMALQHSSYLLGDKELASRFSKEVQKRTQNKDDLILSLKRDLNRYDYKRELKTEEGSFFNIKHNFYRSIFLSIQSLMTLNELNNSSPWHSLRFLQSKGYILKKEFQILQEALDQTMLLRAKAYFKKEAQVDIWKISELKELINLKSLLQSFEKVEESLESTLSRNHKGALGKVNKTLADKEALRSLCMKEQNQSSKKQVFQALDQIATLNSKLYGTLHPAYIEDHILAAHIFQEESKYEKALFELKQASFLEKKFFGSNTDRFRKIHKKIISLYEAQVPIEFSVEADLNHRYRDDQNEILSYPNQSYWLDEKEDDFHLRTLRWVFETIPALD